MHWRHQGLKVSGMARVSYLLRCVILELLLKVRFSGLEFDTRDMGALKKGIFKQPD